MSMEAKVSLLNRTEHQLRELLTAADMDRALGVLSAVLDGYDVTQTRPAETAEDDLLSAYISAMQIQGRSCQTIVRYTYLIRRMMDYVKVPTREITVYHLRSYLAAEKARGICDCTLEGSRQTFSAYFNWLQREGLIVQNPTANLGAIKIPKKQKDTFSQVDLEKLKFNAKTLRDRAIIAFLLSTGCRISEMTGLDRADVDLHALECTVWGKGSKERTVYLDPVAGMLISEYLDQRLDPHPALFVGRNSSRITPGSVRLMLHKLQEKTGVENVHPHKFRRTLATTLIHHGMPIQEVAAILGHDKLDTTMRYVVLDKSDVRNSYRKYA